MARGIWEVILRVPRREASTAVGQEVTLLQLHLKWSSFWAALPLLREPGMERLELGRRRGSDPLSLSRRERAVVNLG